MILQPRSRMMDWNLRHCELKQEPPPHPRSCFYLFRHSADKLTHILTFLGWAKGRRSVSIRWQHYEIREQDGRGGALTATSLPPYFSTSIYVLHGFKSDSTVLIIIFLPDCFQEMLRHTSVLGGDGYRWCPDLWDMGIILWLVLLPIVSKYERMLRLESGSSLPPLTLPFPSVCSWEIIGVHFPSV